MLTGIAEVSFVATSFVRDILGRVVDVIHGRHSAIGLPDSFYVDGVLLR